MKATKHLFTHLLALCGTIVLNCVLLSILVPSAGSLLSTLFLEDSAVSSAQSAVLEQPPHILSFLVWGPPVLAFLTGLFLWMRHLTAAPQALPDTLAARPQRTGGPATVPQSALK